MAIHLDLEKLYLEDLQDREAYQRKRLSLSRLKQRDRARLRQLKALIGKFDEAEIWNCHYACLLLMHSWETDAADDYALAHQYAKKAVQLGSNVTKWLFAASKDRMLIAQGKQQVFGTQFKRRAGKWELLPVRKGVSDAIRARYGVPPLREALRAFKKRYNERE